MKTVVLLTNLKTKRNGKKVTLQANTAQALNADELDLLERLTASTGRPHYRDPRNEVAQSFRDTAADDDDDGGLDLTGLGSGSGDGDSGGKAPEATKPLDEMTVKELKAYLDAEPKAAYPATADKGALLTLAQAKAKAIEDENGGL